MIEFDFSNMTIGDAISINYYSSIYDVYSLTILINKFTPLDVLFRESKSRGIITH